MKLVQAGIDLIKTFEGCRLEAYRDSTGIWTVGFGCIGRGIGEGTVWTQEEADRELEEHLHDVANALVPIIINHAFLNDNQFSALVALTYNIGIGNFHGSKLYNLLEAGMLNQAANEFPKWDKAGGKEIQGLLRRRLAEQKLFNTPCNI